MKGKEFKSNEQIIELKDGKHEIAMDFNTFLALEDMYGDMQTAFSKYQGNSMKFEDINNFLTAGINSCIENKSERYTPYEVGKLLDFTRISSYTTILKELLNNAMPKAREIDEFDKIEKN